MFVFVLISKLLLKVDDLGAGLYLPVWKKIRRMTRKLKCLKQYNSSIYGARKLRLNSICL